MEHGNKNKKHTPEHIAKIVAKQLGQKRSPEQIKRISDAHKGQVPWNMGTKGLKKSNSGSFEKGHIMLKGKESHSWKGGITPINKIIRASAEYLSWKIAVFIRDGRKCIWCGSKKNIQADHIKRFADYPELRFATDNGRTLCFDCHITTPTYGNLNQL